MGNLRTLHGGWFVLGAALLPLSSGCASGDGPKLRLADWERGVAITAPAEAADAEPMRMYLWFYEWNMFDAVSPGEHTSGGFTRFKKHFADDGSSAAIEAEDMFLNLRAGEGVVDLALTIWNQSHHDWPETAAIIPCFNPAQGAEMNRQFVSEQTWIVGSDGLAPLKGRGIHFNQSLGAALRRISPDRRYVFSNKWPTTEPDAAEGLIIRESLDGKWVTGIGWDRFLCVQGHNPWNCMHDAVLVGPLKQGESRTITGSIYLFPGSREECWRRYQRDSGRRAAR